MQKKALLIAGALAGIAAVSLLTSCRMQPKSAVVVKPFVLEKYLGKWYEIARLDFRFEKNLNNTTAQYSMNSDGTVRVLNRGYNYKKGVWKEAIGKAKFRGAKDEAALKVSFWGPFYAGYNVIALDPAYSHALIAGKNLDYLWILSRQPSIPEDVKAQYLHQAAQLGFDTSALVWVGHSR